MTVDPGKYDMEYDSFMTTSTDPPLLSLVHFAQLLKICNVWGF